MRTAAIVSLPAPAAPATACRQRTVRPHVRCGLVHAAGDAGPHGPTLQYRLMQSRDVRSGFLQFFESQRHRVVASSSLVPVDDPTLLFTNAGMNQFKDVFLGKEKRDYTRAASSQKCMRVSGKHNDLDNVGPSLRHHTFFEMLGNFSFGDYFKAEAIEFAWRVLTEVWRIPKDRLHASIFKGDERHPRATSEAYAEWRQYLPAEKIVEYGAEDNFWQMGETGPCGRCSEIYFEREDGAIEIWNNVFMEFERSAGGELKPLPAPSIDTGMGLERVCAVLQGSASNYDTDLFQPILAGPRPPDGPRLRPRRAPPTCRCASSPITSAPRRSSSATASCPSNEWRGYVLRKIMRRAMRHGKKLGAAEPFLHRLVDVLVAEMGDAYPGPAHQPRQHRHGGAQRGGALRRGADRRPAPARGRPRPRGRPGTGSCPARTCSASTTRWACRWTSSRTSRASAAWPSTARASTARWKRSAGGRGPAAPSRRRSTRTSPSTSADEQAPAQRARRRLRRLRHDARRGARRGDVRRRAAAGAASARRDTRASSCSTARRSTWKPAARSPTAARSRPRLAAAPRWTRCSGSAPGARARTSCTSPAAASSAGDRGGRQGGRRPARRDAAQPHRHAPAARRAAPGARQPRQAGRLARRARPPALRLRALLAHLARAARRDRAHRQRAGVS